MDFSAAAGIGTMAEAVGGRSTREPLELGRAAARRGRRATGGRLVSVDWYLVVSR
jgi:hypothetical protein